MAYEPLTEQEVEKVAQVGYTEVVIGPGDDLSDLYVASSKLANYLKRIEAGWTPRTKDWEQAKRNVREQLTTVNHWIDVRIERIDNS